MRDHRAAGRMRMGRVAAALAFAGLLASATHADPLYSVTDAGLTNGGFGNPGNLRNTLGGNQGSFDEYSHPVGNGPGPWYSSSIGSVTSPNANGIPGSLGTVVSSNDNGLQVGQAGNGSPYIYDPNVPTPASQGPAPGPGLFAPVTSRSGSAVAVNDQGQVIGNLQNGNQVQSFISAPYNSQDPGHPFSGITLIPNLGTGNVGYATAINNAGAVVGWSDLFPPGPFASPDHAFLYQNGRLFDLNDLIPPNSGIVLDDAIQIYSDGTIAAVGHLQSETLQQAHLYFLQPQAPTVPEPSTLAVFGLAFTALACRRANRNRSLASSRDLIQDPHHGSHPQPPSSRPSSI